MGHSYQKLVGKQRYYETSDTFVLKYTTDAPVDQLHPAFCFRYLQKKYGFPQGKQQRYAVLKTIELLSQKPWGELRLTGRRSIGYHIITELKSKAPIELAKDAHIISFECGNGRMIGYRDNKVFYVFWFDWPKFTLYDH